MRPPVGPVAPPIPDIETRCRTIVDLLRHLDRPEAWRFRQAVVRWGGALAGAPGLNWECARRSAEGAPSTHPSAWAWALMWER